MVYRISLILALLASPAAGQQYIWSRAFSSSGNGTANCNVVTTFGSSVYMGGGFSKGIDFGSGNIPAKGGPDGFLGEFSASNGSPIWVATFGGVGSPTLVKGIAADASGVYVTGSFTDTITIGTATMQSAGGKDIFLAKFSPDGAFLWAQRYGSTGQEVSYSVTVLGGSPIITGYFGGTVNFGNTSLTSAGSTDIFVALYTPTGGPIWAIRAGGTGSDQGNFIKDSWVVGNADGKGFIGQISLAGTWLWSQADPEVQYFGIDNGVVVGSRMYSNVWHPYIANIPPGGGAPLWSKIYLSPPGYMYFGGNLYSVSIQPSGDIVFGGAITDPIDFGGGPLMAPYTGDVLLGSVTGSGAYRYANRYASVYSDYGLSVAGPYSAGTFYSNIDFGGGPLVTGKTDNGFLTKIEPVSSTPITPMPAATSTRTALSTVTAISTATVTVTKSPTPLPTCLPPATPTQICVQGEY